MPRAVTCGAVTACWKESLTVLSIVMIGDEVNVRCTQNVWDFDILTKTWIESKCKTLKARVGYMHATLIDYEQKTCNAFN